MKFEF
jgi:transposase